MHSVGRHRGAAKYPVFLENISYQYLCVSTLSGAIAGGELFDEGLVMPDPDHIAQLKNGVAAWNTWRDEDRDIHPDLREAYLSGADLSTAELAWANLSGANLHEANLNGAQLQWADLSGARLIRANLSGANLHEADLIFNADLSEADLSEADLRRKADLNGAKLVGVKLVEAELAWANLNGANLRGANLSGANLSEANLQGASLEGASMVETNLGGADLTGCRIYGVSAWNLKLEGAKQQNLVIKPQNEPEITVDDIEVAQFIYLMLHNQKIRKVIDTITSKAVLILGRFTHERKAVLDALREELRKRDYLPILFDFELPERQNITETVTLLARMARFIIADLTDPSSIPQELQAIIPSVRVPVQPLLLEGSSLYSMFKDFDPQDYHWVLPVYRYKELEQLLRTLREGVIAPAEEKAKALEKRRRMFEAELTQPQ
jgi:uncharacterized protein YjbI with pentapeptide repeats